MKNPFVELRNILTGVGSVRGVVTEKLVAGYMVTTPEGTKFYASAFEFKVGDEVAVLKNGTIQTADDGAVFYV